MNIKQFRYSVDNFGYLLYGNKLAMAVDGGAVSAILSFIKDKGLRLVYVTNTHGHGDHTTGTRDLVKQTDATRIEIASLRQKHEIVLEENPIQVIHTPGHTIDSYTFHVDNTLITGDTLFNGTVGNCFSGDLKAFYDSIKRLMSFPDDTVVYAGHDYVRDSMAFAKQVDPDNPDIDQYLKTYDPAHVRSTLAEEQKMNPFIRFNAESIIAFLKKNNLPVENEYQRWESIMSID